jgi:hypothetical protein
VGQARKPDQRVRRRRILEPVLGSPHPPLAVREQPAGHGRRPTGARPGPERGRLECIELPGDACESQLGMAVGLGVSLQVHDRCERDRAEHDHGGEDAQRLALTPGGDVPAQ